MVGTLFLMIFYLHNSWTNWNCTYLQQSNMDLSTSWNFLQFWFRCIFYPTPPHPPTGQTVKKKLLLLLFFFFNGFFHFMKFPAILVQVYFLPHPPHPPTGQTVKKKWFFSWMYPFHEISCNFGSGVFPSPLTNPPAKLNTIFLFSKLYFDLRTF